MTPQQLRRTSRMLSAMSSDSRPCRFLMSPDGVRGPVLILDRQQIGASVKLRLMRDGVHRFAEALCAAATTAPSSSPAAR